MAAAAPRHGLVATDLSDQAGSAVRRADRLAAQHNARLTEPHVVPTGLAAELTPPAAQVVIESGWAQDTLPELVRHHAADLVAVGIGSRTRLGYALLGNIAQHVLRDAASDVLVVPARQG